MEIKLPRAGSPTAYPKKFSPQPNNSYPSLHISFLQSKFGEKGFEQEQADKTAIEWWSPHAKLITFLFLNIVNG